MNEPSSVADVADDVRPLLIAAAERSLTPHQFRVFVGHVVFGLAQVDVARALGVSDAAIHYALHGQRRNGTREGGLMKKLIESLRDDAAFAAEVEKLKAQAAAAPIRSTVNWYRGVAAHHFTALAVLMVADELATGRQRREVSIAELYEQVPRLVVAQSLGALRALGFIATDGRTVRILRTPAQLKEVKA